MPFKYRCPIIPFSARDRRKQAPDATSDHRNRQDKALRSDQFIRRGSSRVCHNDCARWLTRDKTRRHFLRAGVYIVMQRAPSLTEIAPIVNDKETVSEFPDVFAPERRVTVWVNRLTGLIGAVFLLLALVAWFSRHGHYRLVLALLIVALFSSILHSYTFEDGEV